MTPGWKSQRWLGKGQASKMEIHRLHRFAWLVIPLFVLLQVLSVVAHHRLFTAPSPYTERDFMSLWSGGRALLEDLDPYDPDVWIPLRKRYGGKWMPDLRAPFPLWTFIFLTPFSAMSVDWGAAAWMVFSEILLGLCLFLLLSQVEQRRPSGVEFALLLLGAFTLRGTMVSLWNGQITFLLLLVVTLFLVLARQGKPFWAGFALAFIVLKPSPFVFFAPMMGLWMIARRRWRTILGGAAGGMTLLGASWLLQPGWMSGWLEVRGKTAATYKTPTLWGMAYEISPAWWPLLGLVLCSVLAAGTGWLLLSRRDLGETEVASLALCASLAITPYAWAYEHALLLIPLIVLFARLRSRGLAWAAWTVLVLVVPWLLYWVACRIDRDTVSFLVPALVGGAFYVLVRPRRDLPALTYSARSENEL